MFRRFSSPKGCNISCFFVIFRIFFCWTSLKLRLFKVENGLLQDISIFMDTLRAICFDTPNKNTLIYTFFFSSFLKKFCRFLSFFSPRCQETSSRV